MRQRFARLLRVLCFALDEGSFILLYVDVVLSNQLQKIDSNKDKGYTGFYVRTIRTLLFLHRITVLNKLVEIGVGILIIAITDLF